MFGFSSKILGNELSMLLMVQNTNLVFFKHIHIYISIYEVSRYFNRFDIKQPLKKFNWESQGNCMLSGRAGSLIKKNIFSFSSITTFSSYHRTCDNFMFKQVRRFASLMEITVIDEESHCFYILCRLSVQPN